MPLTAASNACHRADVRPPPVKPEAGDNPRRPYRGRVLVADDSHVTRTFVSRLLEIAEFAVDVAVDGASGAVAVCAGNYDLVLMDLEMPVMSGIEATGVIRAAGLCVPIIALTASSERSGPLLCAEAGMNGFLQKPFTIAAFELEWERVLLGRGLAQPGHARPTSPA
jgi:CheY-like chemotaxis protein